MWRNRFFSTPSRKFIVADAPGHEQYTRNMVAGASVAGVAVILIDARKGISRQTRRHSHLVALLGIRRIVLAVNKMDLVDHSADVFTRIERDYAVFAELIGLTDVTCIPMSAVNGDNVVERSRNMPWYGGPALLEYLEHVRVEDDVVAEPFRMPVQGVIRPSADFREFTGMIASATVHLRDPVLVLPSGRLNQVTRILVGSSDVAQAIAEQSVTTGREPAMGWLGQTGRTTSELHRDCGAPTSVAEHRFGPSECRDVYASMLSYQSADGSWGGRPGCRNAVFETSYAVRLLLRTRPNDADWCPILKGVLWLVLRQCPDGGWCSDPMLLIPPGWV